MNNTVRLNDIVIELKSSNIDSVLMYVVTIIVENDNMATNRQRKTILNKNRNMFKFTNSFKTTNRTNNVEMVIVN